MSRYRITSSAGVDMGTYEGSTPADALDAMARDAGYESQADAEEVAGPFDGTVVEVAGPTLRAYETGEAIREATPAEAVASAEQSRLDGGAGVISVDGRSCYVEGEVAS